jgi:hypothetical protein
MNSQTLSDREVAIKCNKLLKTDTLMQAYPEASIDNMIITGMCHNKINAVFRSLSDSLTTIYLLNKHLFIQGRKASSLKEIIITSENGEQIHLVRQDEQWVHA